MCAPVVYGMMIVGAIMQAKQQRQAAQSTSRAAQLNQRIALQAGADAKRRGEFAETPFGLFHQFFHADTL